MFTLVKVNGAETETIMDSDGKPLIYETGREAADAARLQAEHCGCKVQPRPISEDSWRARELDRFASGAYERLPEWFPTIEGHFPHHALEGEDRGKKIAFTESAIKGAADRQTRIRAGTYLQRYFGDALSDDEICKLSRRLLAVSGEQGDTESVMFAHTPDEIENVYTSGPRSCMSFDAGNYRSSQHPTRVYSAGDLAVAYIDDEDGFCARALCWPAKKIHGRIYDRTTWNNGGGFREDGERLQSALDSLGYAPGSMEGARMLAIEDDEGWIVPYLDGTHGSPTDADYDGRHLIICRNGDIDCTSTNGIVENADRWTCEHCDSQADEEESTYVEGAGRWCESCVESDAFQCDETQEFYPNRYRIELADGRSVCRSWFNAHGSTCEACSDHFADNQMSEDSPAICENCATAEEAAVESPYHCEDHNHLELPLVAPAAPAAPVDAAGWQVGDLAELVLPDGAPSYLGVPAGNVGRVTVVDSDDCALPYRVLFADRHSFWLTPSQMRRPPVTVGMTVRTVSSDSDFVDGRAGRIEDRSFDWLRVGCFWCHESEALPVAS